MADALFGTDGYRGEANFSHETGINPTTFEALTAAYVNLVTEERGQSPVIIVGSDTRDSSSVLREAVCAGALSRGAEVWDLGIAPTPVIAWTAQKHSAYAIAVTASHNPPEDNGFKPFDAGGVKPSRATLDEIEKRYFVTREQSANPQPQSGSRQLRPELRNEYLDYVISNLGGSEVLRGKSVIIDGANGAVYELAPQLYRALGAQVVTFACTNDGKKINKHSGAADLEGVTEFIQNNHEIAEPNGFLGAFASDGDGDRVMGVDRRGRIVNGNYWMRHLAIGQVGIVGTIYTNSVLRKMVRDRGVEFHECENGDTYVTAKLHELTEERGTAYTRGGEFTGHLIDLEHLSSGDGLYMGAWLATKMAAEGSSLADIRDEFELWPEKMMNLQVKGANAKAMIEAAPVQQTIHEERSLLGKAGRIVVRASGTQPLVRVWAEATDSTILEGVTKRIADALQAAEY